jgi:hypothetical protein
MTAFSSMQYTIGTALERAREKGVYVEIMVDGHWVTGLVVATDAQGVVLDNDGRDHCIARLERVSAVRVCSAAPMLRSVADGREPARDYFDGAVPMPGPQAASF